MQKEKSIFKKLSVIIPLYNEEESLNPLANEIRKALKLIDLAYEIIFVDDGSSDNSLKIIKEICKTDKRFKYLSFQKNYGKSAALQMGFKEAAGDVVVTMDADLQDDPNEIINLLKKLDEGFDVVSGWKKKRFDNIIKKLSSKFFNLVTRIFSRIKIHDFNCGLKAYRKDVTQNLKIYGELHRYIPVLAKWQGYKISETIVQHHPRKYGTTKFGTSRFFKGFIDLLTVMFTTRYIRRPMHFFGFLGMISFMVGIIVNGYLAYLWLIQDQYLSNRPMLFLGILLIIVGVQFFSVGLLGEMLVNNFRTETEYVIKEKG
ncbi:MAG: glycosyl transferase family 2 [Ignavibacteria bacterium RIFOXYB2_FULL_35_12]|nr:MAG: glycosyl transferase family 2 [Ignavibacteria bacterium GWA2_36_19]OGU54503.1 MAG: glycosyl transferase family 2 [Ignavibacteria bacterium GWC2_35_8]OGU62657.1 MAG: glycosyl transferase family 2 [Ignavibacteria bacterium GWF2_35_20]OGU82773.1 MAG: glycosyl transferase family 2 [Ignavibacteria bacterium RIFOXYA2_FULL_35_9]OGU88932.1 MAG: glycosyl transferase family 2 [Ignavibacteria bacterium RIFOXYC12_FULL_35_11]OGU89560.1 MAG: glycosyl transferase family 2 [Ignavibacteria bacterium RI